MGASKTKRPRRNRDELIAAAVDRSLGAQSDVWTLVTSGKNPYVHVPPEGSQESIQFIRRLDALFAGYVTGDMVGVVPSQFPRRLVSAIKRRATAARKRGGFTR